jgi:predicted ribosome quality control (RQC) complex YloA/Tae2 family protein
MLAELEIEKDYLENVLYSIEQANSLKELEEIKSELGIIQTSSKPSPLEKEQQLLKFDINGFEIFVGKNNKQNDYIISKLAKDEDYWFHTRLCAGSHVLLKVKDAEPSEETLFECCKLAREYSSATQPSKVGIIYTKRKFIKKPPKAPLGYVIYKNEKEVLV